MEEYLNQWKGAIIMVTHDRYFLDRVTNKILEIDHGKLYSYTANYSQFLELKAQREEMELASERKRQSVLRMEPGVGQEEDAVPVQRSREQGWSGLRH